jgi:hypothetical protein
MIELLITVLSFVAGLGAHQTDRVVSTFQRDWELMSRYVIGYLTCFIPFLLMLRRLNKGAVKDGALAYGYAGGVIGIAIAVSRWLDDRKVQGG